MLLIDDIAKLFNIVRSIHLTNLYIYMLFFILNCPTILMFYTLITTLEKIASKSSKIASKSLQNFGPHTYVSLGSRPALGRHYIYDWEIIRVT